MNTGPELLRTEIQPHNKLQLCRKKLHITFTHAENSFSKH